MGSRWNDARSQDHPVLFAFPALRPGTEGSRSLDPRAGRIRLEVPGTPRPYPSLLLPLSSNHHHSQGANGTLFNVIDNSTWFPDTAGTAMMASATYRLATHTGDYSLIPFAEKAFQLIKDSIDEEGRLLDTVDPLSFYEPLRPPMWSPEGQAFVLVLQAAKKEFLEKVKRGHHG